MEANNIPVVELPPETSKRGDNSHVIKCEGVGQHRHYAVCLNFLEHYDNDSLSENSFMDCLRACAHKQCDAINMRQEEQEAGKALYYEKREVVKLHRQTVQPVTFPRTKVSKQDPSYVRGWNQVDGSQKRDITVKTKKRPPMPLKKQPEESGIIEMNMADIVNATSTESATSSEPIPVAKPEEIEATGFLPGETPLEYVQRTSKA